MAYCFRSDLLGRPVPFGDDDAGPLANDSHTMLCHAVNVPNTNVLTVFAMNLVNNDGNYEDGGGDVDGAANDHYDFVNHSALDAVAVVADAVAAHMCHLWRLEHEPAHHTEFQTEFSIVPYNNDKAMNLHTSLLLHDHCLFFFYLEREKTIEIR